MVYKKYDIKGTGSPDDNFFWGEPIKFKQYFLFMPMPMVFKFLGCLVAEEKNHKGSASFYETLTAFKDWSGSRIIISLPASLSVNLMRQSL